jgi:hypothetical protein
LQDANIFCHFQKTGIGRETGTFLTQTALTTGPGGADWIVDCCAGAGITDERGPHVRKQKQMIKRWALFATEEIRTQDLQSHAKGTNQLGWDSDPVDNRDAQYLNQLSDGRALKMNRTARDG